MKGVRRTQPSRGPRQKVVFGTPVYVADQLDTVVHALVEASEDRLLESLRVLPRERPLVQAAGDRRDDLGYRQIGYENVITALHDFVELVTARLGQEELQEGAGVAVERTRQSSAVSGVSLAQPRRGTAPRDDRRDPGMRWRTAGDGEPAFCVGIPRDSARPCRVSGPAAPAWRPVGLAP
jgi:hypothetical protein